MEQEEVREDVYRGLEPPYPMMCEAMTMGLTEAEYRVMRLVLTGQMFGANEYSPEPAS